MLKIMVDVIALLCYNVVAIIITTKAATIQQLISILPIVCIPFFKNKSLNNNYSKPVKFITAFVIIIYLVRIESIYRYLGHWVLLPINIFCVVIICMGVFNKRKKGNSE